MFRLEVPLEHPLVRRALEDSVDRVVVADRRRDGLGTVDHDLRGVRVPEGRHQPGALGLGPAQALDPLDVDFRPAIFWVMHRDQTN